MEIKLFQLENLFQNPNTFVFIDLRETREPACPEIDKLLARGKAMNPSAVVEYVKSQQLEPQFPIVLIDEDGNHSSELGSSLEKLGYDQIYVVAGGVKGLLSEF